MLFERLKKAKDTLYPEKNVPECEDEEVVIGQNYVDDNTYYPYDPKHIIPDPVSPNELDCDEDVLDKENTDDEEIDPEFNKDLNTTITAPVEFYESTIASKVSTEEKEESMDRVQEFEETVERPWEDTSGNTQSFVMDFLQKYENGNDLIQELRKDLMKIMSDFYWIKESHREHEPFALDFADALNELSISI